MKINKSHHSRCTNISLKNASRWSNANEVLKRKRIKKTFDSRRTCTIHVPHWYRKKDAGKNPFGRDRSPLSRISSLHSRDVISCVSLSLSLHFILSPLSLSLSLRKQPEWMEKCLHFAQLFPRGGSREADSGGSHPFNSIVRLYFQPRLSYTFAVDCTAICVHFYLPLLFLPSYLFLFLGNLTEGRVENCPALGEK